MLVALLVHEVDLCTIRAQQLQAVGVPAGHAVLDPAVPDTGVPVLQFEASLHQPHRTGNHGCIGVAEHIHVSELPERKPVQFSSNGAPRDARGKRRQLLCH